MNHSLSRRRLLGGGLAAAAGALPSWMPRLAFSPMGQAPRGDVMVVVFQRGAMDGLNAVVPLGDPDYYRLRPTIAIKEPKSGDAKTAIALDGFYGLHPALAALRAECRKLLPEPTPDVLKRMESQCPTIPSR